MAYPIRLLLRSVREAKEALRSLLSQMYPTASILDAVDDISPA